MKFRKMEPLPEVDAQNVPVTVEPRSGVDVDKVVEELRRTGATRVEIIAHGFISADASPSTFAILEKLAYVHVNPQLQLH